MTEVMKWWTYWAISTDPSMTFEDVPHQPLMAQIQAICLLRVILKQMTDKTREVRTRRQVVTKTRVQVIHNRLNLDKELDIFSSIFRAVQTRVVLIISSLWRGIKAIIN